MLAVQTRYICRVLTASVLQHQANRVTFDQFRQSNLKIGTLQWYFQTCPLVLETAITNGHASVNFCLVHVQCECKCCFLPWGNIEHGEFLGDWMANPALFHSTRLSVSLIFQLDVPSWPFLWFFYQSCIASPANSRIIRNVICCQYLCSSNFGYPDIANAAASRNFTFSRSFPFGQALVTKHHIKPKVLWSDFHDTTKVVFIHGTDFDFIVTAVTTNLAERF